MNSIFNILAIWCAASFSGVMLCIGMSFGGYWKTLEPAEFLEWFAANNHLVSNTTPMVFLVTFIGLVGSIWFAWGTPSFKLWAASGLCILILAVMTFGFFVPTNSAFANGSIVVSETSAKLNQWLTVHYGRIAMAMLSAVLGCIAIKA